jgi:hypothetical protein
LKKKASSPANGDKGSGIGALFHAGNLPQLRVEVTGKFFRGGFVMRALIVAAAGPRRDTDNRETWLRRAAKDAGVSFRQTKALYYEEIEPDPDSEAVRKFEAAAAARARRGAGDLAQKFESILEQLEQSTAVLDRGEMDALHRVAGKLRRAYGPGETPDFDPR